MVINRDTTHRNAIELKTKLESETKEKEDALQQARDKLLDAREERDKRVERDKNIDALVKKEVEAAKQWQKSM